VTPERWDDLVRLFGPRGACAGCWCMWMRLPAAAFRAGKGDGNRRALRKRVAERPPGLLAYDGDEPVGWVAVAPREEFVRLQTSRVLAPVAGDDVWAAPGFYVRASHRGAGVSAALLAGAVAFARKGGARSVEGYPNLNRATRQPAAFVFSGFASTFARAGFEEIERRSPVRPIYRRRLSRAATARRTPAARQPRAARSARG